MAPMRWPAPGEVHPKFKRPTLRDKIANSSLIFAISYKQDQPPVIELIKNRFSGKTGEISDDDFLGEIAEIFCQKLYSQTASLGLFKESFKKDFIQKTQELIKSYETGEQMNVKQI